MITLNSRIEVLAPVYDGERIVDYHSQGSVWANVTSLKVMGLETLLQRRGHTFPTRALFKVTLRQEIPIATDYHVVIRGQLYGFVSENLETGEQYQSYIVNRLDEGEI